MKTPNDEIVSQAQRCVWGNSYGLLPHSILSPSKGGVTRFISLIELQFTW